MTWHRVWFIKCDREGCDQGHVTNDPAAHPEGWGTDGSHHLCVEHLKEQQQSAPLQAPPPTTEPVIQEATP